MVGLKNIAFELGALSWLELAARGPFSYRFNRARLTHAAGVTCFSTTYVSMMKYGWVKEVA